MDRTRKLNVFFIVIAAVALLLAQYAVRFAATTQTLSYSEFEALVARHAIRTAVVSDRHIVGEFAVPQQGKTRFEVTRVDPDLAAQLRASGVDVSGGDESLITALLSWVVPALVLFGLWWMLNRWFAKRLGADNVLTIGKSRAKVFVEKETNVAFRDVAGLAEAKEELREVIDFLRDPKDYSRLGARIPKGILLVGPPGTGKTLLARAVAGEARVPFFSISGSEFVELFVGVGAARVRDLFAEARKHAPAIIFIDELDSLGRARGAFALSGANDEREQTLNQLLAELDGFDPREGVVLLAATNRPEILDPALLRAGRFDRQILVDRPDRRDRVEIIGVHTRKLHLAPDVDPEAIAALTPGFTGADLANLANEAALLATRRKADAVALRDFNQAIERIVAGLEKRNRLMIDKERRIVAFHEMGHALVALALPGTEVLHKVSIIPRGVSALGYTIQRPTEDRFVMTRQELDDKLATLLGGRAAEKLVFGALSTGATDDLAKATDIARGMVTQYGMDEGLGAISYESPRAPLLPRIDAPTYLERRYSEATAVAIDGAIRRIVDAALARALAILAEHREILERGARSLLEAETLDESALRKLAEAMQAPRAGVATAPTGKPALAAAR